MNNTTRHTYPSEIDVSRRCWRKWAFKYLGPREQFVQGPSQILGDELHNLDERWNKLAEAPVAGRSVADDLMVASLPFQPVPKTGRAEGDAKFTMPDANGAPLKYGRRCDWTGLSDQLPRFAELETFGVLPVCKDNKTSSNPVRYGLWTREQFLEDTAAVVYMFSLALEHNADCVGGRWLYLKTPKKNEDGTFKLGAKVEALPSDVVLGRDALGRAHLKVVAPFKRGIDELREQATCGGMVQPLALPFNLDACNDYGKPCEYLDKCAGHFDARSLVQTGYAQPSQFAQHGMGFAQAAAQSEARQIQTGYAGAVVTGPQGPQVGGSSMGFMQQSQGFQPPPAQGQGGFQPPAAPAQQQGYAQPPQGYAPPQAPQGYAPQQQGYAQPPQAPQQPQGYAPPQGGFQPPAAPQQPQGGFQGVNAPEAQQAYGGAPQQPQGGFQPPAAPAANQQQGFQPPAAPAQGFQQPAQAQGGFQPPAAPAQAQQQVQHQQVPAALLQGSVTNDQALDALRTLLAFLKQA